MWEIRQIEYFLKVADTRNFSRAARELYISPQALHKQILQLEGAVGHKLFERTTRSVRITPAGRVLYDAFLPVKREYDRALETVRQQLGGAVKRLHITFFQALPKTAVVTRIVNYLAGHDPTLEIQLESAELDTVYPGLMEGAADLCITNKHDYETWSGVEIIKLASTPAQIAVSLLHPWMVKDVITQEDMAQMPILLMERSQPLREDSFYRNIRAAQRQYVPDFTSLLANLDLGRGYAVFPSFFENAALSKIRFFDLPPEYAFQFDMICAYKPGNRFAPLFREMAQYFHNTPIAADLCKM